MICPPPSLPPVGLCYCGCGFPTNIAKKTSTRDKTIKGQPNRYIHGHEHRGRKRPPEIVAKWMATRRINNKTIPPVSDETRAKMSAAHSGPNHWNWGRMMPQCVRDKISLATSGERNGNWKGGITKDRPGKVISWRKSVYERDGYLCQFCEVKGKRLNAHHIKPWAHYPELRYEVYNGVTLCTDCHYTYYGGKKVPRGD